MGLSCNLNDENERVKNEPYKSRRNVIGSLKRHSLEPEPVATPTKKKEASKKACRGKIDESYQRYI